MKAHPIRTVVLAVVLGGCLAVAQAADPLGPAALQGRHAELAAQLAANDFGGPLVLQSQEVAGRIDGDIFAVVDHPFEAVSAALSEAAHWCDILILHLNTKHCRRVQAEGAEHLELRVGRKEPQALEAASLLEFAWRPPQARPGYLLARMEAPSGPYDTRDYRLFAEAVPLPGGRSFLHLGYGMRYGGASQLAIRLYLATLGRDKVGFTRSAEAGGGHVDGVRGVVERNTMRYYLALDAYLQSLSAPPGRQVERRLQAWFDATEKYPRQLHELEREAYLRMKRAEVQRQAAAPPR